MTIGELSKRAGLRPSAVRYYERLGVVPAPIRRGGRRDYGPESLAYLAFVQFARSCDFTIVEIRQLIGGFDSAVSSSRRWAALAETKRRQMDHQIARLESKRRLLEKMTRCHCETVVECGRRLLARREKRQRSEVTGL